jgi:hypothetical protein
MLRQNKIVFIIASVIVLLLVAVGVIVKVKHHQLPTNYRHESTKTIAVKQPTAKTNTTSSSSSISYIYLIVDENQPYSNIVNNPAAPYLNSLINKYALATNYYAVAHPSLPNYLALTSGSTDGITTDCNPPSAGCIVNVPNIANEIQASGRTWKEYAESMPSNCYAYNAGEYATKHNPFVYYSNIINNASLCNSQVVPFSDLINNLSSIKTTVNYAFITPNLCNDMHDCSVATGDAWLAKYVPIILNSKAFTTKPSLLFITWDEGYATTNHVATILAGSAVKNGYKSGNLYSHYSLLHTIEYLWHLPALTTNDSQAPIMTNFLKVN